jgi:hypothetical protein
MKMEFGLWNVLVFLVVSVKVKLEKRLSKILRMQLLLAFKFVQNGGYRLNDRKDEIKYYK